ncbi:MAG: hypothetical protein ABII90_02530 [Bacteroidota bacterium]
MPSPLEPDRYYHIYNHANGKDDLFASDGNYRFFLDKYGTHIASVADTFCYCLMPNHFHLLVCIKSEETLESYFRSAFPKFRTLEKLPIENLLSKQFSNLFSAYTQAFNKQQNRKGSLFMKNFKRKPVKKEKYLIKLAHYIHYNPVEHGFCEKPEEWKYSSYNTILSDKSTMVLRKEVIEWFEDLDNFIYCHSYPPVMTGIECVFKEH